MLWEKKQSFEVQGFLGEKNITYSSVLQRRRWGRTETNLKEIIKLRATEKKVKKICYDR